MPTNQYGFTLTYQFPVAFTTGVFEPDNLTLRRAIAPRDGRRHRVFWVVDDGVLLAHPDLPAALGAYLDVHGDVLQQAGALHVAPGGEACKVGMDAALEVVSRVNDLGIDRQSFVAVIGGGAVLDMASFAAAIAHRGVRVVRLPTTTLAQGDSGFAVKNGVNLFGKKNFAGTFAPPWAVVNDSRFISTLHPRDRRSGLAEAVKVALLKDASFFEWLEGHAAALDAGEPALIDHAVQRSAELHLAHICGTGDPFELGSARPLDFGHWAAHKLEALSGYEVRHGEAVAIGIALDVRYAVRAGWLAESVADRIVRTLQHLGFRLFHPALQDARPDGGLRLLDGLQEFREHLGGELHITMVRDIGGGFEVHDMSAARVTEALADLAHLGVPAGVTR